MTNNDRVGNWEHFGTWAMLTCLFLAVVWGHVVAAVSASNQNESIGDLEQWKAEIESRASGGWRKSDHDRWVSEHDPVQRQQLEAWRLRINQIIVANGLGVELPAIPEESPRQ